MYYLLFINVNLFLLRVKRAIRSMFGSVTYLSINGNGLKFSKSDLKDQNDLHDFIDKCGNNEDFHNMVDKIHNSHFETWEKIAPKSSPKFHFSIGESDSGPLDSEKWIHISKHQTIPTGEPVGSGVSSVVKNAKNMEGLDEWAPYIGIGGILLYVGLMLYLLATTPPGGSSPSPLKDFEEICKDD